MELEPSPDNFAIVPDRRPLIPEPLPVNLVAISDVWLLTLPGIADKLEAFYVTLLGFEREPAENAIVVRAENFRLRFDVVVNEKPIERDGMRPQGIEVKLLAETELKLIDAKVEYQRQHGLVPGRNSLLLKDPAGNWIELSESVTIT